MKKFLACLITLMMVFSVSALAAETAAASATVYVSITDAEGALVLAYETVTVTDADNDGALTINDALYAAHAAKHENGADAYASVATEYGLSMTRLWGAENGDSYGYYVNNASAWSLTDPVAEGDHVKAFVYTDLTAWSDTYCFFDTAAANGPEVALTLSAAGYDAAYNPVTLPVANAVITVNGEATAVKTDAEGKAVITLTEAGVYVVSAVSETQNLIAPVCIVTVGAE